MKIIFNEMPHPAYVNGLFHSDVPGTMLVSNEIKILFNNVFEKDIECYIDKSFIDNLIKLPIVTVGGDYCIFGSIIINIIKSESNEFEILNLKIFKNDLGWYTVIENGQICECEREPDPDWI